MAGWTPAQARYDGRRQVVTTTRPETPESPGLTQHYVPTRHGIVARTWCGDDLVEVTLRPPRSTWTSGTGAAGNCTSASGSPTTGRRTDVSDVRPVWLLDVDGVVNANRPGWGGAPRKAKVAGFTIRFEPKLIVRIRQLHHTGTVDIRWCSTWCGYPDQLAALEDAFGLTLPAAFGCRPMSKTWGDLKAGAACKVLEQGRQLVWTDDDEVDAARELFPPVAEAGADGRALLIQPTGRRGLQPEDMDAIEAFLKEGS